MAPRDRLDVARDAYRAFETGERGLIEAVLADDFSFSSPADVRLDRDGFFERCWPNAANLTAFAFERLAEVGDEVFVTYVATRVDGSRFRNAEILTFEDDRIARTEVYFGWDIE